jgi:hypothetical protein
VSNMVRMRAASASIAGASYTRYKDMLVSRASLVNCLRYY